MAGHSARVIHPACRQRIFQTCYMAFGRLEASGVDFGAAVSRKRFQFSSNLVGS